MNNKRCSNCGFINFVSAESCRKCETGLSDVGSPEQVYYRQAAPVGAYQQPYQMTPPKSGGFPLLKVFLYLAGGLMVAFVVASGIAGILENDHKIEWRMFRPPQGGFDVMMPSEPRANEPLVTPVATGNMTNYGYRSVVTGQGSAIYVVITFPGSLSSAELASGKLLEGELNNILGKSNSTLVSKKSILIGDSPGLEFEVRPPGLSDLNAAKGFGKLFVSQNQEYFLMVTASDNSALLADKDLFLNLHPK